MADGCNKIRWESSTITYRGPDHAVGGGGQDATSEATPGVSCGLNIWKDGIDISLDEEGVGGLAMSSGVLLDMGHDM